MTKKLWTACEFVLHLWKLQDEGLCLLFEKSYDEHANRRKTEIGNEIRRMLAWAPASWLAASVRE